MLRGPATIIVAEKDKQVGKDKDVSEAILTTAGSSILVSSSAAPVNSNKNIQDTASAPTLSATVTGETTALVVRMRRRAESKRPGRRSPLTRAVSQPRPS